MISELSNSGSMGALEAMLRFAGQRQRLLASNIANISTAGYIMKDVSVTDFQKQLSDAVDRRRASADEPGGGQFQLEDSHEVRQVDGHLELVAGPVHQGILFHDRNNRDVERLMQMQVENAMTFRVAADLLKSRYDSLRTAISERV